MAKTKYLSLLEAMSQGKGKGEWREAHRRRQRQAAIPPSVMPNPVPPGGMVWATHQQKKLECPVPEILHL